MIVLVISIISAVVSLSAAILAANLTHPISVIGTFASLTLSRNAGIAFGLPIPSPWKEILIFTALTAIAYCAWQSRRDSTLSVGFGLILGGAIANLIDRFGDGYVTDYFAIGTFPVFNVADSCITVGVILVILTSLMRRH